MNPNGRDTPLEYGPWFAWGSIAVIAVVLWSRGQDPMALLVAGIVAAGPFVGLHLGGYRGTLSDEWIAAEIKIEADHLKDKIRTDRTFSEGRFLTFGTGVIIAYVAFFYMCTLMTIARSSGSEIPSSYWLVAGVTALTLAFMSAATVRFARFIRIATLLKIALDGPSDDDVDVLISPMRSSVFRGDNLFEPAGNIFVTIGITATFLGLAIGLVNLDLSSLFPATAGNASDVAGQVSVTHPDPTAGVASLKSFVGCMGLALGVSMLGVVSAILSQWLRGRGPDECTDDLLKRATERIRPRDPDAAQAGAAEQSPPPAPSPGARKRGGV